MDRDEARRRFAAARVARLATVDAHGRPHLVPVVFAADGDTVWFAVDHKPKRTTDLARLRNIAARPDVSLLVDNYVDDDWSGLWWVRADGRAEILELGTPTHDRAVAALADKYPQHRAQPPAGPAVAIRIGVWRGWSAATG